MAKVLGEYGSSDAKGTAEFCSQMDNFFDCFNVCNKQEYMQKGKKFLKPFESEYDERFFMARKCIFKVFLLTGRNQLKTERGNILNLKSKQCLFHNKHTMVFKDLYTQ